MALSCVVESGDPAVSDAVQHSGAPQTWTQLTEGLFGEPLRCRSGNLDLAQLVAKARRSSIRFIVPGDAEWPERLADLQQCPAVQRRGGVPFGLWLRGPKHLGSVVQRSVSVVGSRAATSYGNGVATDLSADLAEAGTTVISGGAFGIDAAAHRGALAVRGPTVCVLANGVDVGYPRGNAALIEWLAQDQLLVSELPPGATPTRMRFLARNRLIAALSLGTVVVEAALRSGARNTATWASECGRAVMAVPGPVHSALSEAPHLMIRNGQATLVTRASEVLELISPMGQQLLQVPHGERRLTDAMAAETLAVFEAVPSRGHASAGEIALSAGVSIPRSLTELSGLEAQGLIEGSESGWRLSRDERGG